MNRYKEAAQAHPGTIFFAPEHPVMSLRDYLAGQALTAIIGHITLEDARKASPEKTPATTCAEWAYQYADAMLKARADTEEKP